MCNTGQQPVLMVLTMFLCTFWYTESIERVSFHKSVKCLEFVGTVVRVYTKFIPPLLSLQHSQVRASDEVQYTTVVGANVWLRLKVDVV